MQNVVITGGSRGIGAAAVRLFSGRGDRVWFLYEKNHAAAEAVARETGAQAICCDVSDEEAVKAAALTVDKVQKATEGMQIVKTILVKNRLINLIVKPQ